MVAHAVGQRAARLAGRGHHLAAGAHAEGINAPPAHVVAELVFPPGQGRVACRLVVKAFFNLGLQVLGPEPHRKGLAFQRQAALRQHGKGIPGRVAHRQHQVRAGKRPRRGFGPGQPALFHHKAGERRVEQHPAAQRLDLGPDGPDDPPQQVGAHMGLLPPRDLGRGAVLQQGFCHLAAQRVADAGGELAI